MIYYFDENYNFDEEKTLLESSKGKLKSSFRTCVNPENGHMIKVVFDLDPKKVSQIGDHSRQSGRDWEKDFNTKRNIRKNGCNDFSSRGTVKAIVDMDTGEKLKSVKTLGVVGNDGSRFNTSKYSKGSSDERGFGSFSKADREKMASEQNLKNAKDITTFTVGEEETRPSYKSTTNTHSTAALYNNQFNKRGRGAVRKEEQKVLDGAQYRTNNMHINNYINKMENKAKQLEPEVNASNDEDAKEYLNDLYMSIKRLKKKAEEYKDEKYGQVPTDTRYQRTVNSLSGSLSDLQYRLKELKNKK